MESRASIAPGLPKPDPTISYWQDPPADIACHRSTEALPASASTVIIGSGITGASLAFYLLSKGQTPGVVLLEARTACSGATGRNGGHTKCASYRSFIHNVEALGVEEAARITKFEYDTMRKVHDFAREHKIECDSWQGDTVDVIYDEDEWKLAKDSIAKLHAALGPEEPAAKYQFWNAAEAAKKFLTPDAKGAVTYEAGSISAYKFAIGILKLALANGLNLQTETPATAINKGEGGWTVMTERGSIAAKTVVLATNGYTAHLWPPFQGLIVPLRGHVTAQRPGSGLPRSGLPTTYSFIYRGEYEYMIPRPPGTKYAGDIIIGGASTKRASDGGANEFGCTDDTVVDTDVSKCLEDCTEEYFRQNWGADDPAGRVRRVWSGIMGFSVDGFPFIGEVEPGLFVAASFQGHGMVLCLGCAEALSAMMWGGQHEQLPRAFWYDKKRLEKTFKGRLHAVRAKEAEDKAVA